MKIIHFYHFDSDPRFPPFLLYVRWKSGVTFVWRCFRDGVPMFWLYDFIQTTFLRIKRLCMKYMYAYTGPLSKLIHIDIFGTY